MSLAIVFSWKKLDDLGGIPYHICEFVLELRDQILDLCLPVLLCNYFLQLGVLSLLALLGSPNVSHALDDPVIHCEHHLCYDLPCFILETEHLILIHYSRVLALVRESLPIVSSGCLAFLCSIVTIFEKIIF